MLDEFRLAFNDKVSKGLINSPLDILALLDGYFAEVDRLINVEYDEVYKEIEKAFTNEDLAIFTALKLASREKFQILADETVAKAYSEYLIKSIADTKLIVIEKLPIESYFDTLSVTEVGNFQQAKGLDGVWIYTGGVDKSTRKFCRDLMADKKEYNEAEKLKIQFDPLRKYNCRHRFRFVEAGYYDN